MENDMPSITSLVEIPDIKTNSYEWNVLVSPYSKMLTNFESIGTNIRLNNIQFNKGDLASLSHSLSLLLYVREKQASITFDLESNNKFTQCELLVVAGNLVKATIPFNLERGTYNLISDQYPWTIDTIITNWDDNVDTLRFVFNVEHHPRQLIANFRNVPITNGFELEADRFFLSRDLSDVIFICEEEEFNAHRYALACKSTVFEKMFLANMKEKIQNRVKIEDMNKTVFKEFLNFFYSEKIDETRSDYAIPLLAAADKYDVAQLKETCVSFLLRNLSPENALETYSAAETYNSPLLKIRATDVIKRNRSKHSLIADKKALQYYIQKHPDLMFELFRM